MFSATRFVPYGRLDGGRGGPVRVEERNTKGIVWDSTPNTLRYNNMNFAVSGGTPSSFSDKIGSITRPPFPRSGSAVNRALRPNRWLTRSAVGAYLHVGINLACSGPNTNIYTSPGYLYPRLG